MHAVKILDEVTKRSTKSDKPSSQGAMDPDAEEIRLKKEQEIIRVTQRLIASITIGDNETYSKLCDEQLTCFEPEAKGNLVEGMDFHKFYSDTQTNNGQVNTTIVSPRVILLSEKSACISYVRLTQRITKNNESESVQHEETRIWMKKAGGWKCVHFHRSNNSYAKILI